jgi:hypothetical protein
MLQSKSISTPILACSTPSSVNLEGHWFAKDASGRYTRSVKVPGIINDPAQIDEGAVWLKRQIVLPEGDWETVSLLFKGARYNPAVYINGDRVSFREGGMGPRRHYVNHADLRPGNTITLEVELMSLADMSEDNASYTPVADHWRSSVSAYLWDDVVLHFHKGVAIDRMIPFTDIHKGRVDFHVYVKKLLDDVQVDSITARLSLNGEVRAEGSISLNAGASMGVVPVEFNEAIELWSPDRPNLYELEIDLISSNEVIDRRRYPYGAKEFKLDESGKQFILNGEPFRVRANTVVWPRWVRNAEGYNLAWEEQWFEKNIILRSKDLGVNTLRFHLGNPPERYIELCNEHGLLVQYEWSFFHGLPATLESLLDQWPDWFDLGVRHPSVGLFHPYNETNPKWLPPAWTAINQIIEDYPPILIADRDVTHVHKYWWSLFENLGLFYDSYEQFPTAIMVDEFGGNYLDANYAYGLYKTVGDTFQRFLGHDESIEQRIKHHIQANTKVGEYWRRIGAAGYSPFCALGSHEDGSHWFEGDLKEGNPKPVWEALAVIWSPLAASIDLWDQNFTPGQVIDVPIHFINDTSKAVDMEVLLTVEASDAQFYNEVICRCVPAFETVVEECKVALPVTGGEYWIKATVLNKQAAVKHPVVSAWDFRILNVEKPAAIHDVVLGIPEYEAELFAFGRAQSLIVVAPGSGEKYDILMLSRKSWVKVAEGDEAIKACISGAVGEGRSVLLLDVGPQSLGQGYPKDEGALGPLQGVTRIYEQKNTKTHVFGNVSIQFGQAAEPESHVHAHPQNDALWKHLTQDDVWLWNGYRGGLIVPADHMEVLGLSREGFSRLWTERGADLQQILENPDYTAYSLEGYFAFSENPYANQAEVIQGLRDHIKFIQDDAPALAASLDPGAPVEILKLNQEYQKLNDVSDRSLSVTPLAVAGKGLRKKPVILIDFEDSPSRVLTSQMLTSGRLAEGFGSEGAYGVRYDPAAVQMVLNMINLLSSDDRTNL